MDWFSNREFWELFYDCMFPPESFEQAREQAEDLIKLTRVTSGNVLDLCCGPGRHSVPLSKAALRLTGVDLQSFLLEKAADYARRENVSLELVQSDMRMFRRNDAFDLVLSMFSSFGYFADASDDLAVLQNAHDSLRSGGKLVLDLRGKEIHARDFTETMSLEMPNGDLVVQRTRNDEGWARARTRWIYISGQRADSFEVSLNLYSGAEIKNLLEKAGFSDVQLYGDLKGAPYDHNAKRLIAVANKD